MAYDKFKLRDLREKFGIDNQLVGFLPSDLRKIEVSPQLLADLSDVEGIGLASEKAKSELIVTPVLKEIRRKNIDKISFFSGYEFNVDSKLGLNGYCDFILSSKPRRVEIESPIFCFVEAKKDDIDAWLGQCGAEMYAAKIFNEREGNPTKVIYGCVTNAFLWCFIKLEDNVLTIDPNYIPLTFKDPNHVVSILQWFLDESLKH
jgi:hypothetical protein